MKLILVVTLVRLAAALPQALGGQPHFPELLVPNSTTDGIPNLSALAGLDYSAIWAQYGPLLTQWMTPEVTKSLAMTFVPSAKVGGVVSMTPRIRQDAKRKTIKYGPFTMLGQGQHRPALYSKDDGGAIIVQSMDADGQAFAFTIRDDLCGVSCTVLAGQIGLTSEDGEKLGPEQGIYVHHINSFDIDKPTMPPVSYCGTDDLNKPSIPKLVLPVSVFLGRGEDYGDSPTMFTTRNGSYESGYHTKNSDVFIVQGDIVNYSNEARKVFVTFDLEYIDGARGRDVTSGLISVIGCKMISPNFNPTGAASTRSQKYPVDVSGTFITAKGHMHNGGDAMIMRVNGKEACVSKGVYKNDVLVDMTVCEMDLHVKADDYVELESIYDVAKHPLRKDVMGMDDAHSAMGGMDLMGDFGITFAIDEAPGKYGWP